MNNDLITAYQLLKAVYIDKAYLNIAMQAQGDKITPQVTKLVYGVIERDIELGYYLSKLATKGCSIRLVPLIKLGMYALKYMDGIPAFAVVNEIVEMTDTEVKKPQLKGFVNAILNALINKEVPLPNKKFAMLSILYSKPEWLVVAIYKQYGEKIAENILSINTILGLEHIRRNMFIMQKSEFEQAMQEREIQFEESQYGGYYVKNTKDVRSMFDKGLLTFQSPSSMLAVKAIGDCSKAKVLDICSAPGGKAIYLQELYEDAKITACDLHEHRVELIEKYATRMGSVDIVTMQMDATVRRDDMLSQYDVVLCDAPCSGLGVMHKKPDVLLDFTYNDVQELAKLQYEILNNAIDYCKTGGKIIYSTCTILREENYNIIGKMLKDRQDIKLTKLAIDGGENGFIQLMPSEELDGFFIAALTKI